MKKLLIIIVFFLAPMLALGQGTLNNNAALSQIASSSSLSKKQVISTITGKLPSNISSNVQGTSGSSVILGTLPAGSDSFTSLVTGLPHPTNTAVIEQVGDNNLASVNQFDGTANLAVLKQAGNNITTLVTQMGIGNVYGSQLKGDNHYLDVSQIGANNLYLLEYSGDKTLNHTVQQIGNNLQAIQVGSVSKPFSIKEQGVGMKILIKHNQY